MRLLPGNGRVHGQHVLNEGEVGAVVEDVVDADEEREHAEAEGEPGFR